MQQHWHIHTCAQDLGACSSNRQAAHISGIQPKHGAAAAAANKLKLFKHCPHTQATIQQFLQGCNNTRQPTPVCWTTISPKSHPHNHLETQRC